jgi:ribonuclease HIII
MMKFLIILLALSIERIHRYLYDNWFYTLEDKRYRKWTLKVHLINKIYNILAFKILPKWRDVLIDNFESAVKFQRYNKSVIDGSSD